MGNVVTGKGNIVASRKHAVHVMEAAIERFLGLGEGGHEGEELVAEAADEAAGREAQQVAEQIGAQPPAAPETIAEILQRVRNRQQDVGYPGDEPMRRIRIQVLGWKSAARTGTWEAGSQLAMPALQTRLSGRKRPAATASESCATSRPLRK